MEGCWNVILRTRMPSVLSTVGCAAGMTLAGRYLEMDDEAELGPPVTLRSYDIPYSIGMVQKIVVADQARSFRLMSRNSQLSDQILHDVWRQGICFPRRKVSQSRPTMAGQIVIFAGWKLRGGDGEDRPAVTEDSLRRGIPRMVWELAMADVCERMGEMIQGPPHQAVELAVSPNCSICGGEG